MSAQLRPNGIDSNVENGAASGTESVIGVFVQPVPDDEQSATVLLYSASMVNQSIDTLAVVTFRFRRSGNNGGDPAMGDQVGVDIIAGVDFDAMGHVPFTPCLMIIGVDYGPIQSGEYVITAQTDGAAVLFVDSDCVSILSVGP